MFLCSIIFIDLSSCVLLLVGNSICNDDMLFCLVNVSSVVVSWWCVLLLVVSSCVFCIGVNGIVYSSFG